MRNLFGEGRHPDAERLEAAALDAGATSRQRRRSTQLGRPFAVYTGTPRSSSGGGPPVRRLQPTSTASTGDRRSRPRCGPGSGPQLADEMFAAEHGRAPLDDRERAGFLARASRQQTTAVAGYDLTFTPVKSVSALWALADRDGREADRGGPPRRGRADPGLAGAERVVHPARPRRGPAGQGDRADRGGVHPPRLPRRGPRPAHPRRGQQQGPGPRRAGGSPWTGGCCTRPTSPSPRCTTPCSRPSCVDRLGVRFTARPTRSRGRQREAAGPRDRRRRPAPRRAAWSRRDRSDRGPPPRAGGDVPGRPRPPTDPDRGDRAGQQANLETRQAKHAATSRGRAARRLARRGDRRSSAPRPRSTAMVEPRLGHDRRADDRSPRSGSTRPRPRSSNAVEADRATWQVWHLRAEADRRVRAAGIRLAELESAVDRVVAAAITSHCIAFDDPDPLTDP